MFGGYDGGPDPGFDWNGNGHRDMVDDYMDYNVCNDTSCGKGARPQQHRASGSGDDIGKALAALVVMVLAIMIAVGLIDSLPLISAIVALAGVASAIKIATL